VTSSAKPNWATTTNERRKRPMVTFTLSPEALERLDVIAADRGQTRSGAVEEMIRRAKPVRAHAKKETPPDP
jgi:DNA-binding TFAR19-related protein (PDSD5 family)